MTVLDEGDLDEEEEEVDDGLEEGAMRAATARATAGTLQLLCE